MCMGMCGYVWMCMDVYGCVLLSMDMCDVCGFGARFTMFLLFILFHALDFCTLRAKYIFKQGADFREL